MKKSDLHLHHRSPRLHQPLPLLLGFTHHPRPLPHPPPEALLLPIPDDKIADSDGMTDPSPRGSKKTETTGACRDDGARQTSTSSQTENDVLFIGTRVRGLIGNQVTTTESLPASYRCDELDCPRQSLPEILSLIEGDQICFGQPLFPDSLADNPLRYPVVPVVQSPLKLGIGGDMNDKAVATKGRVGGGAHDKVSRLWWLNDPHAPVPCAQGAWKNIVRGLGEDKGKRERWIPIQYCIVRWSVSMRTAGVDDPNAKKRAVATALILLAT